MRRKVNTANTQGASWSWLMVAGFITTYAISTYLH